MKHLWKAIGLRENKFCEARCLKCRRTEDAGCDWPDADKQIKFWDDLSKLDDCTVEGKSGICKFPILGKNSTDNEIII